MTMRSVAAAFNRPEDAVTAAREARASGFPQIDIIAPYAVEGVDDALGLPPSRVRPIMFAGAVLGGAGIFALQGWSAVIDYPINSGGRALFSWPAFLLPTFEVAILGAALAGFAAMLLSGGLPRLHHGLFEIEGIDRATQDRFFVLLSGDEDEFDSAAARRFLDRFDPVSVREGGGA